MEPQRRTHGEKTDATDCGGGRLPIYAQAQSRFEVFALVESNREG